MKINLKYILFAATAVFALAACQPEELKSGEGIRLTVLSPGYGDTGVQTKATATMDGVYSLNENLINSVYYFFYPEDVTDQAPVIKGHFNGLKIGDSSDNMSESWDIPVSTKAIVDDLFDGTSTCRVFLVANPPSNIVSTLEGSPTLAQLRAVVVQANFNTTSAQSNFVMIYEDDATLTSKTAEKAMDVTAEMTRLADKLTVNVQVIESYYDSETDQTFSPLDGAAGYPINVTLCNGMCKANLAGDFETLAVTSDDYVESAKTPFANFSGTTTIESKTYKLASASAPIYTYPMIWDFADNYEPYLLFEVTWQYTESGATRSQKYYYKLMLSDKSFESNHWYNITVRLSVLGSLFPKDPTQVFLDQTYQVLDWNNAYADEENNVNADVKDARYLVIDRDKVTIRNLNSATIAFSSSHPCEVASVSVTGGRSGFSLSGNEFTVDGNVVKFRNDLVNDINSDDLDTKPYTFTVTIKHTDNASYNASFTLTQIPAILVTNLTTPFYSSSPEKKWTFFNGLANTRMSASDSNSGEGSDSGWAYFGGSATNMNIYTVGISVVPEGSDYLIGDPRDLSTNAMYTSPFSSITSYTPNSFTDAPDVYDGTSRELQYYYRTSTSADKVNVIAPKFRISSALLGYGGTMSYAFAELRCATYQENGYPAGRWRLPTKAEIEYVYSLQNGGQFDVDGVTQTVFASGRDYWCATGGVKSDLTYVEGTSTNYQLRCVYDAWYWDEISATRMSDGQLTSTYINTFHWGDKQI